MTKSAALSAETLKIAAANLGKKEATGHNDGVFVSMLQRWLANGSKWMDGQPWCAAFATWCLYQAARKTGLTPTLPKNGSSTSIYAFAHAHGLLLEYPEVGCIGLMKGDGGTKGKTHHHTFLVESVDRAHAVVHSIDGNWKNSTTRTVHSIGGCNFVRISAKEDSVGVSRAS